MKTSSLQQRRVAHALGAIEALRGKPCGNYVSYVKGLAASILQNGLGQALATLLAAAKGRTTDAHHLLFDQLERWLCRNEEDAPYNSVERLMEGITNRDEDTYLRAHAEALAYLTWLKKFAVAYLNEKKQED